MSRISNPSQGVTIGGTVSGGTTGSVLFVGTGPVLSQDNANFFWNDSQNRLGLGITFPQHPLHIVVNDAGQSSIASVLAISHNTTGTPANGIGVGLVFQAEVSTGTNFTLGRINAFWTDVTNATRTSSMIFQTVDSGSIDERMRIAGDGKIGINVTDADAMVEINTNAADEEGLKVKASASQTADLLLATNSSDTKLWAVEDDGQVEFIRTAYFDTEVDNGNSGTADTIDWQAGNKQRSTLTDNVTYTFTAPQGPCSIIFRVMQDATGSRTVTWPSAVQWAAGTAPTLSTAASAIDLIAFYFDGTNYLGGFSLNYS